MPDSIVVTQIRCSQRLCFHAHCRIGLWGGLVLLTAVSASDALCWVSVGQRAPGPEGREVCVSKLLQLHGTVLLSERPNSAGPHFTLQQGCQTCPAPWGPIQTMGLLMGQVSEANSCGGHCNHVQNASPTGLHTPNFGSGRVLIHRIFDTPALQHP